MLLGQYESSVGEKNRIAFPKKFRLSLGDNVIITKGYENALIIVSEDGWKALLDGTQGRPFIESATRETQRFLLGNASLVELDSKGRFVLPTYLRNFAKIKETVVFLGLDRYVELWDKNSWEEYSKRLEGSIDSIARRLIDTEGEKAKGND